MQTNIKSTSPDMTERYAEKLGQRLRGGEIIELVSDLGGGKTTFVRGLARGLGSPDRVHSPSFTVSNQYQADAHTLYHFDFYRLDDPGIIARELAEIMTDKTAIVVVEWAAIVDQVLLAPHLVISLQQMGEYDRTLTFEYPKQYDYLFIEET
jgi:tRNA threonylcarbamoyladenosine biosynthesis protein TsaE